MHTNKGSCNNARTKNSNKKQYTTSYLIFKSSGTQYFHDRRTRTAQQWRHNPKVLFVDEWTMHFHHIRMVHWSHHQNLVLQQSRNVNKDKHTHNITGKTHTRISSLFVLNCSKSKILIATSSCKHNAQITISTTQNEFSLHFCFSIELDTLWQMYPNL